MQYICNNIKILRFEAYNVKYAVKNMLITVFYIFL